MMGFAGGELPAVDLGSYRQLSDTAICVGDCHRGARWAQVPVHGHVPAVLPRDSQQQGTAAGLHRLHPQRRRERSPHRTHLHSVCLQLW